MADPPGSISPAASNPRLRIANGTAVWLDDLESGSRPSVADFGSQAVGPSVSNLQRLSSSTGGSKFLEGSGARESVKRRRRPSEMLKNLLSTATKPLRRGSNLIDVVEDEGGSTLVRNEQHGSMWTKLRESLAPRLSLAASFTSEEMRLAAVDVDQDKLRALVNVTPLTAICTRILDSPITTAVMTVATIWVLFASDLTQAALPKSSDYGMNLVSVLVFFLFCIEFAMMCIANGRSYIGRLFFFLDMLAILSLLPEVVHFFGSDVISKALSNLSVARAGRAARASSRIARMLRVVRIVRLWRKDVAPTGSAAKLQSEDDDILRPTKVGTKLQASTTNKWVVGLILLLLLFNFTEDSSDTSTTALQNGIDELSVMNNGSTEALAMSAMYVGMFTDILYLHTPWAVQAFYGTPAEIEHHFRDTEFFEVNSANGLAFAYYSTRASAKFQAILSIILTISLIVLLVVGNALFQKDLDTLVIGPISKMTAIITGLAENPLMNVATYGNQSENQYETGLLMTMISKLGYLLQIAFGTAGAKIISENMSTDGDLHPMVPGRKMSAIFGFCDIRTFTDVTEHLKEDVMLFVNKIADVVHTAVVSNNGAPNKNIGDAFLLVWKPSDNESKPDIVGSRSVTRPPSGRVNGAPHVTTGFKGPGKTPRHSNDILRSDVHKVTELAGGELGLTISTDNGNGDIATIVVSADDDAVNKNDANNNVSLPGQMPGSGVGVGAGGGGLSTGDGVGPVASSMDVSSALHKHDNTLAGHEQSVTLLSALSVGTLKSFLETQEGLVKSDVLGGMVERLQKVMPNYRLKMGFGFHVGWAIEGPIGSNYKVDASYLSPHVNITARLESATKQYGVDNLFSGQFFSIIPKEYRHLFLKLDLVMLKGSRTPVYLFTLNPRLMAATEKDYFSPAVLDCKSDAVADTKRHYEAAVHFYMDGHWRQAREMLAKYDTPTDSLHVAARVLLDFMQETNFVPPRDWVGVRALTDK